MAAHFLHFGIDLARRLMVLQHFDIEVLDCRESLSMFSEELSRANLTSIGGVLIAEGNTRLAQQALETACSHSYLHTVLFQEVVSKLDASRFDLVIPSFTPPPVWVEQVRSLLERSKQFRFDSNQATALGKPEERRR